MSNVSDHDNMEQSAQSSFTVKEDSPRPRGTVNFGEARGISRQGSGQPFSTADYYFKSRAQEEEIKSLQQHINMLQERSWKLKCQNDYLKNSHCTKVANAIEKFKKQLKDGEFEAVAREVRSMKSSYEDQQDEEFQLMQQTKKWKERHDSEKRKRLALSAENEFLRGKLADVHTAAAGISKPAVKEVKQSKFQPFRHMANLFGRNKKDQLPTAPAPSTSASTQTSSHFTKDKHTMTQDSPISAQEISANESAPLISKAPATTTSDDNTLVAGSSFSRRKSLFNNPQRSMDYTNKSTGFPEAMPCGRAHRLQLSALEREAVQEEARRLFQETYGAEQAKYAKETEVKETEVEEEVVENPFSTPESDRSCWGMRLSLREALSEDSLHREAVARMNEG